jgi:lysozyme
VEGHVGQPAVLKVSPGFEERYHIAGRIERNLWLTRDWWQPDYAGRPWTLWTANAALRTEAGEEPVRWVVLQP